MARDTAGKLKVLLAMLLSATCAPNAPMAGAVIAITSRTLELVDPADVPRFRELGVAANFQPLWAFADDYITQLTIPALGPERSSRLYPIGTLYRSGVEPTQIANAHVLLTLLEGRAVYGNLSAWD
jgi:predicted amidohydrolase YtcJ